MIPLVSDFNPTSAVGGRFLCHRKHCQAHQSPVALALETHWSGHFHCLFGELVPNSMWVTFRVRSTGWWVLWLFKAGGGRRDGGAPLVAAKRALNKREGERKTHPVTNTHNYTTHTHIHTHSLTHRDLIYETRERKRVESYFKFSFLSACRPGKTNRPEAQRIGI